MKRSIQFLFLGLSLSLGTTWAQNFTVNWSTTDGGGGQSTGGSFTVNGTIGQPDAGHQRVGNFTLDSGFWGLTAADQSPSALRLTIRRNNSTTVAVSWPSPSTGFVLQQNTNGIAGINWSNAPGTILDDGAIKSLIINPATGNRFFRLFHP